MKNIYNLSNKNFFKNNYNEKSISFFCRKKNIVNLHFDFVDQLLKISKKYNKNSRICFHSSPKEKLHESIICQSKYNYYRPKKHLLKDKSFTIIKGKLAIIIFDKKGNILEHVILSNKFEKYSRISANTYHVDIPITKYCIHFETTLGPFNVNKDVYFPDWGPIENEKKIFRKNIFSILKIKN